MITREDTDFYKSECNAKFSTEEIITFKLSSNSVYYLDRYDWYMKVALAKANLVRKDRHLLTKSLLVQYQWAIREAYSHELDSALRARYSHPKHANTIKGIEDYIERIKKLSKPNTETK